MDLCRLCLTRPESIHQEIVINIQSKEDEILQQHFWFHLNTNKLYSSIMCLNCWQTVDAFHVFYKNVENVHRDYWDKVNVVANVLETDGKFTEDLQITNFDIKKEDQLVKIEVEDTNEMENVFLDDFMADDSHCDNDSLSNQSDSPEPSVKITKPIKRSKNCKTAIKPKRITKIIVNEAEKEKLSAQRLEEDRKMLEFFKMECELCEVKFCNFAEVASHYRLTHSMKRGYIYCCSKKFNKRATLLEHMHWHLDPSAFTCKICHRVYRDAYGLKTHMSYHAPDKEKIYICDVCGRAYANKAHLRQHLHNQHFAQAEENKIHKCDDCGRAFGLNSILQSHIRGVHQSAYVHICDICAKTFKSKLQCELHQATHTVRTKVQCKICGSWVLNLRNLRSHTRRMHEEKGQTCAICGKQVANKDALRSHVRYMHEIERSFKCTLCDKSFKRAITLKEHMASHAGTNDLYTCFYCPKTFNSNANMHSHRKKVHPVEWQRDRKNPKPILEPSN